MTRLTKLAAVGAAWAALSLVAQPALAKKPHGHKSHAKQKGHGHNARQMDIGKHGFAFYGPHVGIAIGGHGVYVGGGYHGGHAHPVVVAGDVNCPRAERYARQAKHALEHGRFDEAVRAASHAVVENPANGELILLQAEAFFAVGDVASSAAAVHRGLALLPREAWVDAVRGLRSCFSGPAYFAALDGLTRYLDANPDDPAALFLRGYHAAFAGHAAAARNDLGRALELNGRDPIARELLVLVSTPAAIPAGAAPPAAAPVPPASAPARPAPPVEEVPPPYGEASQGPQPTLAAPRSQAAARRPTPATPVSVPTPLTMYSVLK